MSGTFGRLKLNPCRLAVSDAVGAVVVCLGFGTDICFSFSSFAGISIFPEGPNLNDGKEILREFSLDSGTLAETPNASTIGYTISGRRTTREDEGPCQSMLAGIVLLDRRNTGDM